MKIQINSLGALERLIGGDTQIELEIRQNIAEAFAKKYIKNLFNLETIKAFENTIVKELQNQCFIKKYNGWELELNSEQQKLVRQKVQHEINLALIEVAKKAVNDGHYLDLMNKLVESQSSKICDFFTSGEIERRISEMADLKIKDKLGIK